MVASVIINNFNYGRFVGDAIESALAQTHSQTEVIVVDDGSTDESREAIGRFGDRVIAIFKENGGMASTHNVGFAASRGQLVVFLDADDMLLPAAVEAAFAVLDSEAVHVHWPVWVVDGDGNRIEIEPSEPLAEGDFRSVVVAKGPFTYRNMGMSANAWARRFLERVLPMPEREFPRHSDAYLCNLAPLYGTVRALREPQTLYRVHGRNDWAVDGVTAHARRILATWPSVAAAVSRHLAELGIDANPERWERENEYYGWLAATGRALDVLERIVPPGATFALADADEWGATDGQLLPRRRCVPLPEEDGLDAGAPANDEAAVRAVEQAVRAGATHVVFPWFALWWLEHYPRLREDLQARGRRVADTRDVVAYALDR